MVKFHRSKSLSKKLFDEPIDFDSFESLERAYHIHHLYKGIENHYTWKEVITYKYTTNLPTI